MHCFVIAEAAATHDGNLDMAHALVDLAHEIGADAVKFQWTSSPERMVARRHADEYLDAYRLLAFPIEWHGDLAGHATRLGLEYLVTVYLTEDIAVIAPYVRRFKIASFEAGDRAFVEAHREYDKPILVSCGMGAARHKYPWLWGTQRLHCVSAYPTPDSEANILRVLCGSYEGYSDHTQHRLAGALAVAAGARIVEFHLRLYRTRPENRDYDVARCPEAARDYIHAIRTAETLLGDGVPGLRRSELPMLAYRVSA